MSAKKITPAQAEQKSEISGNSEKKLYKYLVSAKDKMPNMFGGGTVVVQATGEKDAVKIWAEKYGQSEANGTVENISAKKTALQERHKQEKSISQSEPKEAE